MNKIMLSIIIPIYMAEKYLSQCIQSVLNQTFSDFELILVDDGSPDNSGKICDEFATKDFRIKVIHKQNEGSILARRTGFENSSGKYVSFIDADDWIECDFYKSIFEKINFKEIEPDVFCCGFTSEFDEGTNKTEHNWLETGSYEDEKFQYFLEHCLYNGKYFENGVVPALWCKVFNRNLVENVITQLNPIIKMGEDAALSYCVFAISKRIFIDNENTMYHYRRLNNSMSTSYDARYFERIEALYKHFMSFFSEHNVQCLIDQAYYYFTFLIVIGFYSELSAKKHFKSKNSLVKILNQRWIFDVMSKTYFDNSEDEILFIQKQVLSRRKVFWFVEYYFHKIKNKVRGCFL